MKKRRSRNFTKMNDLQKKFFEEDVIRQRRYMRHPLHRYQKMKRYLHATEMANIRKTNNVLDVGCGIGYQISLISRKCGSYFGVDFSQTAIKYCMENFHNKKSKFIKADALRLPFRKGFFDVVLLMDILENTLFPEKILQEAKRVLKDDGRIVVSVPNVRSLYFSKKRY